jgi:hypothetical protein
MYSALYSVLWVQEVVSGFYRVPFLRYSMQTVFFRMACQACIRKYDLCVVFIVYVNKLFIRAWMKYAVSHVTF